jgi:hypothetical protein
MTLVWGVVIFAALMAFVSLAVDLGRVQLVRTELQHAADAAARYAAIGFAQGVEAAQDYALAVARENRAGEWTVALDRAQDVEFGSWDAATKTFTPLSGSARPAAGAIRITARRVARRGTAVPLLFTRWVGVPSCDVTASAIVTRTPAVPSFIAMRDVSVKNALLVVSYNSSNTVNPDASSSTGKAMLAANGAITAKNGEVLGSVVLGPAGTHNLSLPGEPIVLGEAIPPPPLDFSAAPATNPGGVSKDLVVNGTRTLAGGTYHFTSVTLNNNATLTFSGPATLYIDGSVIYANNGSILAYGEVPGNLKIRQRGAGTTFGGASANDVTVVADLVAPQTDFLAKNDAHVRGRAVVGSLDARNNAELYYDELLYVPLEGVPETATIAVVR